MMFGIGLWMFRLGRGIENLRSLMGRRRRRRQFICLWSSESREFGKFDHFSRAVSHDMVGSFE